MTKFPKVVGALACAVASCVLAQDAVSPSPDVAQLSQQLQQTRVELNDSKRQIEELRQSLEELRRQVQSGHPAEPAPAAVAEPTVSAADQEVGFLAAKINEMHQDKVESASRYPVKLSGLILFNSYWNKGILDIQDLPSLALPNFPGALHCPALALRCGKLPWASMLPVRNYSERELPRARRSISRAAIPQHLSA